MRIYIELHHLLIFMGFHVGKYVQHTLILWDRIVGKNCAKLMNGFSKTSSFYGLNWFDDENVLL